MIPRLILAVALGAVLNACAADLGQGSAGSVPSPLSSSSVPQTGATEVDVPAAMLDAVVQLAADDTGIAPGEIRVVTAEAVTWSDGSLGCPEEGQMYTQALVPGYRVVLDVAGEEVAYHASEAADFRACADPMPPVDGGRVDR